MRQGIRVQNGFDLRDDVFVCVGIVDDLGFIGHDPAELPGGNAADAVAEREADHHQHTAAGDADDGDQDTVPVRSHVAENQTGVKTSPGGRTGFFLPARSGTGPLHQRKSGLPEQLGAAQIHRENREPEGAADHDAGLIGQKAAGPGTVVEVRFIAVQNGALHRKPRQQDPKPDAQKNRGAGKEQVFPKDFMVEQAHGLVHADQLALLLDHAGDGGVNHQGPDDEKDRGKGHAQGSQLVGIGRGINEAGVAVVVERDPAAGSDVVETLLCRGQLLLGVLKLLLSFVKFLLAIEEFLAAVVDRGQRVEILLPGVVVIQTAALVFLDAVLKLFQFPLDAAEIQRSAAQPLNLRQRLRYRQMLELLNIL